jgi:hypothetical protein
MPKLDQRFDLARVRAAFFAELLRFLAFRARVFAAFQPPSSASAALG